MNSKKLRVAFYDYVDSWNPKAMKESASIANWIIKKIEKDDEGEVVTAMVDVLLKEVRHPYNMFIYGILNKKYGKVDKVIFIAIEKFGMDKVKELYEKLRVCGISLEFIKEGPVDDKFIETYTFVKKRELIWTVGKLELIGPVPDRKIILTKEAVHPDATVIVHTYKTRKWRDNFILEEENLYGSYRKNT